MTRALLADSPLATGDTLVSNSGEAPAPTGVQSRRCDSDREGQHYTSLLKDLPFQAESASCS